LKATVGDNRSCLCAVAVFFKDYDMAEKILREKDPRYQKSLAKSVKDFDETEWNKVSQSVVEQGSLEKVIYIYILHICCVSVSLFLLHYIRVI